MRHKVKDRVMGIYYVVLVPLIFVIGSIVLWVQSALYAVLFLIILAFIYLTWLSSGITYGPQQIRQVQIPNGPEPIVELLKTTTIQGDPIYVYLLAAFEDQRKLSQSGLADNIQRQHKVTLRLQSIRPYILKLEKQRLIHSPTTSRDKQYTLTPQGQWCLQAVKTCFPRSNFWFIIRHYLGIQKLPKFPKSE